MSAYVGLDVHSERTYATILDGDGKVIGQGKLANRRVPEYLRKFSVERIGLEASTHGVPLYRALVKGGYRVQVSHPKKTRYIAEAKIKTDRVDSRVIAELVRLDALPSSYVPPPEIAELREKVRRRAFLVRDRAKLKTKIKNVLAYEGIVPPREHGLFTEQGKTWLRSLNLEPVECYLRIIAPLSTEIRKLSSELQHLARDDEEVKLLMTIPGIGYYTALLVKAEVGDVNRFSTGEQLCSYAGIVTSTHSSAEVTRHGRITREGSRWLRWAMVEAALVHLKYDTSITRAYHRIAERQGKQKARVAAARKLLMCCWAILKSGQPYHDQASMTPR
jgi:transposase